MLRALALLALTTTASAQWTLQNSGTTASLRGIHSLGDGVAWASGTNGTVLRTEDGGKNWQHCATPPNADKLDFRGVQAFDAKSAIIMSSGKGDASRLYKTTDGCQTWKLTFTNPDKEGFWDAISIYNGRSAGVLIGDPVDGHFSIFANQFVLTEDQGWERFLHSVRSPEVKISDPRSKQESLFAASNSVLIGDDQPSFVTGGADGAFFYSYKAHRNQLMRLVGEGWYYTFFSLPLPLAKGEAAGAFSIAGRSCGNKSGICVLVAVGGDYKLPDKSEGTATFGIIHNSSGVPAKFEVPNSLPGGYRSAVAYDASTKTWITVGPNGTDISTDDGRNWHPLKPNPTDQPDADKNWNALSLPFVVGPKGRIGILNPSALKPSH